MACQETSEYYTIEDYSRIKKVDTHIHTSADNGAFEELAKRDNFQLVNIVVDTKDPQFVLDQYASRTRLKTEYPDVYEFITSFSVETWDDEDFVEKTIAWLDEGFEAGAVGVKVWKNIGMEFRDKNGELIFVDDPKLDPIFDHIEKRGKTLIGHLAEPKNCWLPLEEMIVNNDKDYFRDHQKYHMYLHPEMPSYEEQIAARDRMLEKHPNLTFVGAHMGSLEHDVDELAKRLDKFPNMAVDLAARIGQVFYQTIHDREKVRDFFIRYQDRLLYATDIGYGGKQEAEAFQTFAHETWMLDWKFFVTDEWMTSDRVNEQFQGLKLPKEVVDKIFYKNAIKWFKMFPGEE